MIDNNAKLKELETKFSVDLSSVYNVYPAPVVTLCDLLGINLIINNTMESDFYGQISYDKDNDKFTITVSSQSTLTNIFTVAHELGHYLLHNKQIRARPFLERRAGSNNNPNLTPAEQKMEIEANQFAADLLMPEGKFIEQFRANKNNISQIQKCFSVSERGVYVRAVNLGLIFP